MTPGPARTATPVADRLEIVPTWAAVAAVTVAAVVGAHGTAHLLFAPTEQIQVSSQATLGVLWGITTLVALGGLAALGGAYAALAGHLDAEPRVDLDILPDDERHVLAPILDAPGVTQVEVVGRTDYSDAKVSQTLASLRERGLVYREPQGRTYRLYPGRVFDEPTSDR